MSEVFEYKYEMAKKEMQSHNIKNSIYIDFLVRIGIKVRPFQYGGIILNVFKLYPTWFVMFYILSGFYKTEFYGGGLINAIFIPLLCCFLLAMFFYKQRKSCNLSNWDDL
ncbi:DUF6404 family protein [Vibrio bathopelagicus]